MENLNQIEVRSLSSTGEGVGHKEGLAIFIEGALPNELVTADLYLRKKNYAKANLVNILKPSSDRVKPPCPYFDRCGGCQVMHLDYRAQLKLKTERVLEAMRRIAKIKDPEVHPCAPSPDSLAYRNKIQLPAVKNEGSIAFGLYAKQSHDVVPVDACLIHNALGETLFKAIQKKMREFNIEPYDSKTKKGVLRHLLIKSAISTKSALVVFIVSKANTEEIKNLAKALHQEYPAIKGVVENVNTRDDNVILGKTFTTLAGASSIDEIILGKVFAVSPASFFQVNPKQAENLYTKAIEWADLKGNERLLDAYSGVGVLSLLSASHVKEAVGVEYVREAVLDAERNAQKNNITNASFYAGKTEILIHKLGYFDTVFLNPPRKGCEPAVLEALVKMKPKNLIYISCDPATLARDLNYLIEKGFRVAGIQLFDMFPQTMHVETIVKLISNF